jgi:hypothetical protein
MTGGIQKFWANVVIRVGLFDALAGPVHSAGKWPQAKLAVEDAIEILNAKVRNFGSRRSSRSRSLCGEMASG